MIVKRVICPNCKGVAIFDSSNENRPFCSSRCQLGDLAAWAADGYRIPGVTVPISSDMASSRIDTDEMFDI
jgi:endogenous inhibitor of DNA gyrase (YacG/DUF329 family)